MSSTNDYIEVHTEFNQDLQRLELLVVGIRNDKTFTYVKGFDAKKENLWLELPKWINIALRDYINV